MIKQRPAYESSDGSCHKTYEEAQKAELVQIFAEEREGPADVGAMADLIMKYSAQIREILKPAIGRPTGSRNGSGRRRTSKTLTPDKITLDTPA